jgi:hypothetical protein
MGDTARAGRTGAGDVVELTIKDGTIQLGDITDKIMMLEVACCRWECRNRFLVVKLIAQHSADMRLTELCHLPAVAEQAQLLERSHASPL